jgi:hypothetical protein
VLRINYLAIMCLGLLMACGPGGAGEGGALSEESVGQVRAESVSTTTLAFGSQERGTTTSPAKTVTVTNPNSGNQDCNLSIGTSSPFWLVKGDGTLTQTWTGQRVSGNNSRDFPVVFIPTTLGAATGTLTMASCSVGASVSLSGTGTSSASVAPTSLTFDPQKTDTNSQPQSPPSTSPLSPPRAISRSPPPSLRLFRSRWQRTAPRPFP